MTPISERTVTVAAVQVAFDDDIALNIERLTYWTTQAHVRGAQVVLLPELLEGRYFCQEEQARHFERARERHGHPTLEHFCRLARALQLVIPVSFFERAGPAYYNSVAVIDADGTVLGIYRKAHIPDGPGYEEKFYFRPGDTGFRVWPTRYGRIGIGICWDQWFPECARALVLRGAEILMYPTAIGSEPGEPDLPFDHHRRPWQRAMVGHAVSNVVPVVAANRVGQEGRLQFFGHSFIADPRGDRLSELDATQEGVVVAPFDLKAIERERAEWGFFRDRRPELYGALTTADGERPVLSRGSCRS